MRLVATVPLAPFGCLRIGFDFPIPGMIVRLHWHSIWSKVSRLRYWLLTVFPSFTKWVSCMLFLSAVLTVGFWRSFHKMEFPIPYLLYLFASVSLCVCPMSADTTGLIPCFLISRGCNCCGSRVDCKRSSTCRKFSRFAFTAPFYRHCMLQQQLKAPPHAPT